jgi:NAD(P)-dependent dehydrogenase (short-subunit alcohol dehydrogenase family)
MATNKTILITGAGSGFGEGTSIGLANAGYHTIAGVQISQQVTALRRKATELGIEKNLQVEKLDILDEYDVNRALTWDVDVLFNNAGYGESGPVFEIPVDLLRRNFETNVFAPLSLSQKFAAKFIREKKKGKIVFYVFHGGLLLWLACTFCTTKFALEGVAEALSQSLCLLASKFKQLTRRVLTGFNDHG